MLDAADLPDDVATLKAMLIAAQACEAAKDVAIASKDEHIARKDERIERLENLVAAFKQAAFGRKSEKTDPDQFDLALEDLAKVDHILVSQALQPVVSACVIDKLGEAIPYDDFVESSTAYYASTIAGERGQVIRNERVAKALADSFREQLGRARKSCFIN